MDIPQTEAPLGKHVGITDFDLCGKRMLYVETTYHVMLNKISQFSKTGEISKRKVRVMDESGTFAEAGLKEGSTQRRRCRGLARIRESTIKPSYLKTRFPREVQKLMYHSLIWLRRCMWYPRVTTRGRRTAEFSESVTEDLRAAIGRCTYMSGQ